MTRLAGGVLLNALPNPDPTVNGLTSPVLFPGSIYTTPLPASPIIAATSPTIVAAFNSASNNDGGPTQDSLTRGPSRYVIPLGKEVPLVKVNVNPGQRWDSSPVGTVMAPIPWKAVSSQWTSDQILQVIDYNTNLAWTFWVMGSGYAATDGPNTDGSWNCNTMIISPIGNNTWQGMTPWSGDPTGGLSSQISASKADYNNCCITINDIIDVYNGGSINHMVAGASGTTGFYIPPALSYDGAYYPFSTPEGTIFTWPRGATNPATSLIGQAIWQAIYTYGLAIFDMTAGNGFSINIENPTCWWNYLPWFDNAWQPYLPGQLLNWGNNSDGAGHIIMTAGFNWNDLVQVTARSASCIVNNETLPGAPQGLTATPGVAGDHQIVLNWSAPSSSGTNPINGYIVYIGASTGTYDPQNLPWSNGGGLNLATNASTFTYTASTRCISTPHNGVPDPLVSGTTYYVTVCAVTNSGFGPPATEASCAAS